MLRSSSSFLAVAALAALAPHAASAQSFYDDGPRPFVMHAQDDIEIDGDRARIERRRDVGPGYRGDVRPYGPRVVYDERDPYRRREAWRGRGHDGDVRDDAYDRPAPRDDRPAYGYGARPDRPDGRGYGPIVYGADPMPVGPVPVGAGFGGGPDVGCTIERTQSLTAAGWHKIVTHRTCYRR